MTAEIIKAVVFIVFAAFTAYSMKIRSGDGLMLFGIGTLFVGCQIIESGP
jgi:Na+/phosphate symporter